MTPLSFIPWQAWALAAVLALGGIWHWRATEAAYARGVSDTKAAAVIEAARRIKNMETVNENFRRLPADQRCIAFMRDSGLPDSACD